MAAFPYSEADKGTLQRAIIGWTVEKLSRQAGWTDDKDQVKFFLKRLGIADAENAQKLNEYRRDYLHRDLESDARIGNGLLKGDLTGIPDYIIEQINVEKENSTTNDSTTEQFFVSQAGEYGFLTKGIPVSGYGGSDYYNSPGESEETLHEDSHRIARAVEKLGRLPTTPDEWNKLSVLMYSEGVPFQVNREIVEGGIDTLSYYLDLAGITSLSGRRLPDISSNIGLIIHDVLDEWKQIADTLRLFLVDEQPLIDRIMKGVPQGNPAKINEYLAAAGKPPVRVKWDIPDYTSSDIETSPDGTVHLELISMQQIRDAYMNGRITLDQYQEAVEMYRLGFEEIGL